jgi:ATP-dependent helicase/nuclease subunit B
MPTPRLQVLPWTQPLPRQVAAWLAQDWSGDASLDLHTLLVVVPTRQSGRRLREALAAHAAACGQAVWPPSVVLPEDLLRLGTPATGVASRLESLLAWIEVLRAVDLAEFREVFPLDPPVRNFAWAQRLASQLLHVQATLAEAGLRLADVPSLAAAKAGDFSEAARWAQLAELERCGDAVLAARGLRDAQAAKIAFAAAPTLPPDIARIVVLATPDPLPLAVQVLTAHARTVPVEIVVIGPPGADAALLFDEWGRPRTDVWSRRLLAWVDFEERVHLCPDPAAQAGRVVALAGGYGQPAGVLAVGVADPAILPSLDNGLLRAGFASFDPEGTPRRRGALHALLAALAEFAREPAFDAVAALARCPDVLAWLQAELGSGFSPARFLAALDELHTEHLPPTLEAARGHAAAPVVGAQSRPFDKPFRQAQGPEHVEGLRAPSLSRDCALLSRALDLLAELRALLTTGAFPANATAALTRLFSARTFDLAQPVARGLADDAEAWRDVLAAVARAAAQFAGARENEWWELALDLFGESKRFDDKPADAVELLGWLELLWEDAPHLVVAGFNDGHVPEAVVGDAFLPESLREKLGLKTNATRFARDAYLLAAIAAARGSAELQPALENAGRGTARAEAPRHGGSGGASKLAGPREGATGRLDLLVGKVSAAGDPLRPSRLLLLCDDALLPARVRFLFREIESSRPSLPWRRAWTLRPRPLARPFASLNVTAFRDYLACPFRFYLKHGLGMEAVDPEKTELDARDFGNLCHAALQTLGEDPGLRDCTDEKVLREALLGRLEAAVRARYGGLLTLPLVVQLESARQRLRKAAEVQARERAEGWVIERVEWKFPAAPALVFAGLAVRGKIDRIDRHEGTGAVRVLDYKTSDQPVAPRDAHCRRPRRDGSDDARAAWTRFTIGDRELVWIDLQLPLYLHALQVERAGLAEPGPVQCGYFNLPKAAGETAVALWDDYSAEWQEAARRCAEGVAVAVAAGEFWPPAERSAREDEDWAGLFHQGAAESVEWRSGSAFAAIAEREAVPPRGIDGKGGGR